MTTMERPTLLLVGHGGVPKDMPREWVRQMKALHRRAAEDGDAEAQAQADALEAKIRHFPRTEATDPYAAGIGRLAERLRAQRPDHDVVVAFNEFCAPTIEAAIQDAVGRGATTIRVLTTMITPGGSHSEVDIPAALAAARRAHPEVTIEFVWPLDLDHVATMYAAHLG